jgi:hypothetical protein
MYKSRNLSIGILLTLFSYICSYIILSSGGQYVPGSWGLGWVKHYIWAPRGFVRGPEGLENRRLLQILYFPLWWADYRLVHTSSKAGNAKYPINTLLDTRLKQWMDRYEQNKTVQQTGTSRLAIETNSTTPAAGSNP